MSTRQPIKALIGSIENIPFLRLFLSHKKKKKVVLEEVLVFFFFCHRRKKEGRCP